jgi:apolipoprotein N-acyltransferase
MSRSKLIQLSVLSGLLLIPAWCRTGTGLILLFAFIPLLFVEDHLYRNKIDHRPHQAFLYAAITFLVWNAGTTWWLWNATIPGMFVAFLVNTLLMSIIFWLFHITRRNTHSGLGQFAFIAFWLVYEHYYMNGEINWPWLNLGNGFANDIHIIQWYEYTGTFGGSFWVLLVNILAFNILKHFIDHGNLRGRWTETWILAFVVLVPIVVSLVRFTTYREKEDPREIVVLQPNIDPYNEKFGGMGMSAQMDILMRLADSLVTPETDFIVAPETFINDNLWTETLYSNPHSERIYRTLVNHCPNASFIVGCIYKHLYPSASEKSKTAREIGHSGAWYDSYNAAIQIDTSMIPQVYIKSKLVVGVEKMPYTHLLGFLRKLTVRLGGTFRSHGIQEERENFYTRSDSTGTSPVICYESVFGEYVTDYIKKGSDFIFIITNDGWWGNTPGHRQHQSYARLRAIETRRSVARSANTGISSLINQKGQVLQSTRYWEPAAIRGELNANDALTFYTRHGDFIARIAYFFSLLIALYTLTRMLMQRKK